jgi:hypothetical protein
LGEAEARAGSVSERTDRRSRSQIDVRAEGLIFKSGSSPEHRVFTEAAARGLPQGGPFCPQHLAADFFGPCISFAFSRNNKFEDNTYDKISSNDRRLGRESADRQSRNDCLLVQHRDNVHVRNSINYDFGDNQREQPARRL